RKYQDIKLVTDSAYYQKQVNDPRYKGSMVISNEDDAEQFFAAISRQRGAIELNKPIYAGFTVLELSKHLMYNFHYNFVLKNFNYSDAVLSYTDTDSLLYAFYNADVDRVLSENSHWFDFSDYPKDHPLYSSVNKKVAGKFKDELNGKTMKAFVGLKSKSY